MPVYQMSNAMSGSRNDTVRGKQKDTDNALMYS